MENFSAAPLRPVSLSPHVDLHVDLRFAPRFPSLPPKNENIIQSWISLGFGRDLTVLILFVKNKQMCRKWEPVKTGWIVAKCIRFLRICSHEEFFWICLRRFTRALSLSSTHIANTTTPMCG